MNEEMQKAVDHANKMVDKAVADAIAHKVKPIDVAAIDRVIRAAAVFVAVAKANVADLDELIESTSWAMGMICAELVAHKTPVGSDPQLVGDTMVTITNTVTSTMVESIGANYGIMFEMSPGKAGKKDGPSQKTH